MKVWSTVTSSSTLLTPFFDNCAHYINKWHCHSADINAVSWVCETIKVPQWYDVEASLNFFSTFDSSLITFNENLLFNEFGHLKNIMEQHIQEWNSTNISIQQRWTQIFKQCKDTHINFEIISKIIEFVMCLYLALMRVWSASSVWWIHFGLIIKVVWI